MRYWLMKSEPDVFSIDHLKEKGRAPWDGVRNFQARNFMRDDMKVGDLVLFHHSSCEPPGVAGVARVCREGHPDPTAWDRKSAYFDPRSTPQKPLWYLVDVEFVEKFRALVPLERLKGDPQLSGMMVTRRGARLSVQPVEKRHFERVLALGHSPVLA
jgi:predicted RNA-binding protein with PUA-like domain